MKGKKYPLYGFKLKVPVNMTEQFIIVKKN